MNVVVINLEGKTPRYSTFDLYGHDSTDLKAFLNLLQPGEVRIYRLFFLTSFQIILIASYDDAAFRLDSAARELLSSLGSTKSANLGFRDGWVFIGAKNIPSFEPQEAHIPNEKVDFLPQLVITLQFRTRTSMAIGPKPLKLAGVSPPPDLLGKCS